MKSNNAANVWKRFVFFLKYYFRAKTIYDLHPPEIYAFAEAVLEDKREYYIFGEAEELRQRMLRDDTKIRRVDYGRATPGTAPVQRIKQLVKRTAISSRYGRLLFRIARHFSCQTGIELGTGTGISTVYLGAAMQGPVYSLEGDPELSKLCGRNLDWLSIYSVKLRVGPFSETLPDILQTNPGIQIVFLDGHHQQEATLRYIELLLPYSLENCIFILDDIYWSDDMASCWNTLRHDPRFRLSIDLFQLGILVYSNNPDVEKKHYTLAPRSWKPWRMGFF